jgi:molybdopterin-binding protein
MAVPSFLPAELILGSRGIKEGDNVFAIIKATEVSIERE